MPFAVRLVLLLRLAGVPFAVRLAQGPPRIGVPFAVRLIPGPQRGGVPFAVRLPRRKNDPIAPRDLRDTLRVLKAGGNIHMCLLLPRSVIPPSFGLEIVRA